MSIYSSHIFTFPFIVTEDCGSDRVPKVVSSKLKKRIKDNPVIAEKLEWQEKTDYVPDVFTQTSAKAKLEETLLWNSYRYFYPHVLHNYFPAEENDVYWFSLEAENSGYTISVQGKPYQLKLNRVLLKIFSTGICLLEFYLHNEKYPSLSDIKRINDFGRRLYPQFLGYPDSESFDDFLSASQYNFFSTGIDVSLNGKSLAGEEDLPYKNEHFLKPLSANTKNSTTKPLERNDERILPYFIRKLLQPLYSTPGDQKVKRHIEGVLDDRMFVVCWFGCNDHSRWLKEYSPDTKQYGYEQSNDWYMYAFIDGGSSSIAHRRMQEELIKKITYPRFLESGTLYAATRYSFVSMTDEGWFPANIIRRHMETLYADMMAMLLVQRASIVAFNNEITTISEQLHGLEKKEGDQNQQKRTENEILKAVDILHARIVAFDNRLAHREVTPQEQGIELYKLARDRMDIPEQMDELRQNMEALHNHFEMRNAKQVNKTVKLLTIVSVIFIPLNLVIALWSTIVSMIDSGGITLDHRDGVVFGAIFLSSVLIYMFTFSAIKKMNESEYPTSRGIHFWDFICDAVSFHPLKIIIFFTLLFVLTLAMTAMFF